MIKGFRIALILLIFSNCLYSQVDSIKSQILNYEDSKSAIISKGRKLLLDKFIEGDLMKVKEVKDYLINIEDENYIAFYPSEYWFILYWTKDYSELAKSIQSFDSTKVASYYNRIRPLNDMLYDKLKEKSFTNEKEIKEQLQIADLNFETKQILSLNLDRLLLESRKNIYAQDSLNEGADNFLKANTQSRFEDFTKKYIKFKLVPKNWGVTFEFFSGYSMYTGKLSESYTNNIPIGVAFDICYKNFELYLRDYIGFNKTKKDFNYSLGTWEKGSRTLVFLPEASLGYVAYNDNRFKLSPFAGIGAMDISPTIKDKEETPQLKEVSLEFTTTYIIGINFDIKFGPKHTPQYRPKASYGFIRIRYGYSIPRFETKYDGMTGNMHYITIGFGFMGRGLKKVD